MLSFPRVSSSVWCTRATIALLPLLAGCGEESSDPPMTDAGPLCSSADCDRELQGPGEPGAGGQPNHPAGEGGTTSDGPEPGPPNPPPPPGPRPAPSPDPNPPSPEPNPGSGGKFVGNITTQGQVRSDFMNYWDQITPENEGKWGSVEFARDQMNWGPLDAAYQFAENNGIPFKQHTLVWGSQSPDWVNGLPADQQREEVEEWIREYCTRYPNTAMIDVVNEPDHAPPAFRNALGGAGATGHDWVIWSFETARRLCPGAILILNDYNVLRWDTDNFISIAHKVKDAGYLDAIGCQAHDLSDMPFNELQTNLDRIVAIGVPIYISEYDIDVADDNQQAQVMQQQFPLFYESDAVVGITLWGYIHGTTWVPNSGLIRNNQPRPAMTWLMDYLGR